MEINQNTFALLCELEELIGDSCNNPNSYEGDSYVEGCFFRYPLTINQEDNEGMPHERKIKDNLAKYNTYNISPEELKKARYKFGSNHLYIVKGLRKALTFIEKRYRIDFEKLERSLPTDVV